MKKGRAKRKGVRYGISLLFWGVNFSCSIDDTKYKKQYQLLPVRVPNLICVQ